MRKKLEKRNQKNSNTKSQKSECDVKISVSPTIEEFQRIEENLEFYQSAFNNCEKTLNEIWEGFFGDTPICDTGNFWNCNPIIKERVIKKYEEIKRDNIYLPITSFWMGFFLGSILIYFFFK